MRTRQRLMLCAVLVAVLAACGGDTNDEQLPIDSDPGSQPPAAGACLVDEPECNDTGVTGGGGELPLPTDDGEVVTGGMVVEPLTVSQIMISDLSGVIAVQGFLFDDGSGPVLCETLAESVPPQCGGASLAVSGHEEAIDVPIMFEQGVMWTEQTVVLLGEFVDATLVVGPTVLG
ncbi:MAG: hypothetical protein OEQ47_04585 [Acidimicrobiia bacterium]|nr:hypothetical protein [Acidimicrobiia bacterium]